MTREDAMIVRFCADIGAGHARELTRGGHRRLTVTLGKRKAIAIVAATPGCHRSAEQAIRDVRHQLGLVGGKRVGKRRARRQHVQKAHKLEMPAISVGRDGFYGKLAELAEAMVVPSIPEIPAHADVVFRREVSADHG